MKKYQRGQTIIEAMVALMTILIILTAISIVIVNGLYNSRFIKNQNEANKYAQQGMEFVRNLQQNNLEEFRLIVGDVSGQVGFSTYCIDEASQLLTAQNCNPETINLAGNYNRIITFSPPGGTCHATEIIANVKVSWTTSKCPASDRFCHKSELESCLPYKYPASNP